MKKNLRIRSIILNAMRITISQLVLSILFVGVSFAHNGYSQDVLTQKITIKATEQAFKDVLVQIEKSVEIRFIYSPNLIKSDRKISINSVNLPLNDVLKSLLNPLNIDFKVSGKQIVLKRGNVSVGIINSDIPLTEVADVLVSGKIKDDDGNPMIGVNIQIKGTNKGTTSNNKGEYELNVPNSNAILIFTYIGYTSQEVTVGNRSVVNLILQADNKSLSEVVVVGYGTQKKINLTGAVSTIDSKALENRPSTGLISSMQGLSPGLIIQRTNGQPGSEGVSIQIRGASTANGIVSPLVIVDGVSSPSTTLNTINQNDVESISILKDAAAAAIYGAQAAGGVILITTKKGSNGKVKFNYLTQYGTDWATNVPERMPLLEEAQFANLANKNAGGGAAYSDFDLTQIKNNVPYLIDPNDTTSYVYYNQTPLTDLLLKKYTSMRTHNLSASGGTDKFNFLISGGYYGKDGVFKVGPDNLDRYNFRTNLGVQLTKHLSLDSRIDYTYEIQRQASTDASNQGLIYQSYRLRNRNPFFTPEGRYNGVSTASSAYALLESGGYNIYKRNNLDGVFTLKLSEIIKGLNLRAVYGIQNRRGDREVFARTVPLWGRTRIISYLNLTNSYTLTKEQTINSNLQFLANYDFKIANKHNFGLFAGYQWEEYRFDQTVAGATNLVSNDLPTLNLGNDLTKTNSQSIQTYAYQSIFGRVSYNYNDKYLLEATVRSDESSKLAPGSRIKIFPSVSAGWNIHRENFMKGIPVISELKLRGSYGTLGGALGTGIGNYDYLNTLTRSSSLILGDNRASYINQGSIPSTSLSWETIETTNFGINVGLLQNKLQLTGDYYVKNNRNMLTSLQLPATIGVGTPRINNGQLRSWGWELELMYRNKIGKDFNYSVSVNVSDNQNELVSFSGRKVVGAGTNSTIEGYPLNSIFAYQTAGYFQTADEVKASAFQDSRTGAGDVKYIDRNVDGKINVGKGNLDDFGDLVYLGTTNPRFLFGGTINMSWKGIDFSAFFQGVGQRNYMPWRDAIMPFSVSYQQSLAIHRDYWTPDNPNAAFPRPYLGGTYNYLNADKWTLNASYVRLKNLQVGYTLPSKFTEKLKVSRARIFFSGQDLFTISGLGIFKGYFDPENRDGLVNDYPFFATASMGVNLSF